MLNYHKLVLHLVQLVLVLQSVLVRLFSHPSFFNLPESEQPHSRSARLEFLPAEGDVDLRWEDL